MLNLLDWLVIALIVGLIIFIIRNFAKKIRSAESYYVASKSIPFSLLVGTLVASWYGGPGLLNTVETAAVSGMVAWGIWNVLTHAMRIPMALWVAPSVCMRTEMTIPQMLKKVYGKKVSFVMAIYMLITLLSISEIVALRNVMAGLWGADTAKILVPIVLICVVLLTAFGGMMGVTVTDMLLFFCMCTSLSFAASALFGNIGGWSGLKAVLLTQYDAETTARMLNPIWGNNMLEIITLVYLKIRVYVHANLYQRFSAADTPRHACRSFLTCFSLFTLMDFLLTISGLVVGALRPGSNIAQAYITLSCEVLPNGLRGIYVAGLLGAIISTLDSVWLACGMMIANDIIGQVVPLNDKQNIFWGKISIAGFALLGYLGAFYFTRSVDVTKFFSAMTMSVQFTMAIMGLFYRGRKTAVGAWASMICGAIAYIIFKYYFPVSIPSGTLDASYFSFPISFIAYMIGNRFGHEEPQDNASLARCA